MHHRTWSFVRVRARASAKCPTKNDYYNESRIRLFTVAALTFCQPKRIPSTWHLSMNAQRHTNTRAARASAHVWNEFLNFHTCEYFFGTRTIYELPGESMNIILAAIFCGGYAVDDTQSTIKLNIWGVKMKTEKKLNYLSISFNALDACVPALINKPRNESFGRSQWFRWAFAL